MKLRVLAYAAVIAIYITGCYTNVAYTESTGIDDVSLSAGVIEEYVELPRTYSSYQYGELLDEIQEVLGVDNVTLEELFQYWRGVNDSVCGLISIPDLDLLEPVLESEGSNMEWLRTDVYGEYSYAGAVFMDFRCDAEASPVKLVHGHNMLNDTMFSRVPEYLQLDSCLSAPEIIFYGDNGELKYRVFSVVSVNAKDEALPIENVLSGRDARIIAEEFLARSLVPDGIIMSNDIMILNTCWYGESGNERNLHCLVVASRI